LCATKLSTNAVRNDLVIEMIRSRTSSRWPIFNRSSTRGAVRGSSGRVYPSALWYVRGMGRMRGLLGTLALVVACHRSGNIAAKRFTVYPDGSRCVLVADLVSDFESSNVDVVVQACAAERCDGGEMRSGLRFANATAHRTRSGDRETDLPAGNVARGGHVRKGGIQSQWWRGLMVL